MYLGCFANHFNPFGHFGDFKPGYEILAPIYSKRKGIAIDSMSFFPLAQLESLEKIIQKIQVNVCRPLNNLLHIFKVFFFVFSGILYVKMLTKLT